MHEVLKLDVPLLEAERHLVLVEPRMTRVFAVTNQKGGVGKTTTTVNLAASLAQPGKRVLLVDLDPQGNATMGSGIDKRALKHTVYHVLLGLCDADAVRIRSESGGYDVVPANRDLAGAEVEMVELEHRESRLKSALERVDGEYDFILIDCPPALNLLTVNGLVAADAVMIPMQCEYYALEGLSDLVNTIKQGPACISIPRSRSKGCCAPCSTRATRSHSRCRRSSSSTSATRSTAP